MDKDGKITLKEKFKGLKVSLISAPNMPEKTAVMIVSESDFKRLTLKLDWFDKKGNIKK